MHRAEKSSSKICRSREVERAQQLHRRKISGVKSYLTGIISKPSAARPPNSFRRNQTSVCGTIGGSSSIATLDTVDGKVDAEGALSESEEPTTDDHATGSAESYGSYQDDDDFESAPEPVIEDPSRWFAGSEDDALNLKSDEFRSVAPTSTKKGALSPKFPVGPPPAKKSLNRAFRVRKLREIEASNVGLFDRIKRSASHYRNDDLRREWHQNVSYLSSICEFPLARDILASPTNSQHMLATPSLLRDSEEDDEDLSFLAGKHASITAATTKAATSRAGGASLPSIHPSASAIHPIKAIPTSPKKNALNLAPAFRSLRKAMPQQPGLPPITSPSRGGSVETGDLHHENYSACNSDMDPAVTSPRKTTARLVLHSSRSETQNVTAGSLNSPRRAPSIMRQASVSGTGSAAFIGDLQSQEGQPEAPGDLKYQLLKTGKFVGGTYLVLTVFCGNGVRNPYGFDVYAFHRESKCEYTLSITREMAHELIESSSSRSLAEETEAAAGTNWSMQQIARSICDHVQFAVLENGRGDFLFLMSTSDKHVSNPSDTCCGNNSRSSGSLLVDVSSHLISLCVHQVIELDNSENNHSSDSEEEQNERERLNPQSREGSRSVPGSKRQPQQRRCPNMKRRLHVFASTCTSITATTVSGLMTQPHDPVTEISRAAICFRVFDREPPTRATSSQSSKCSTNCLETEVSIDELYVVLGGDRDVHHRRISIERMVTAAMNHLHIISVPRGSNDASREQFKEALILNSRVNPHLRLCDGVSISVPVTTSTLQRKCSRQQLLTTPTPFFLEPSHPTVLLQTGLVWRDAYLLAQITVSIPASQSHTLYQPWRWRGHHIRDLQENIAIRVFNPTSGLFSERILSSEYVAAVLDALSHSSNHKVAVNMDTLAFSKLLLGRLQLDADLFGAQVITFPELERSMMSTAGSRSPAASPRAVGTGIASTGVEAGGRNLPVRVIEEECYPSEAAAAVVLQAHFRGYLCRKNVNDSRIGGLIESVEEDEEDEEDQEYDEESTEAYAGCDEDKVTEESVPRTPTLHRLMEFSSNTAASVAADADTYESDEIRGSNAEAQFAMDYDRVPTSQSQTASCAIRRGTRVNGVFFLELHRNGCRQVVMRISALGELHVD